MAEYFSVEDGSTLINKAKSLSMRGLYEFKIHHEMSIDSKMFDEMTVVEMDSCGSNFQILNQDIAEVSTKVSGGWINSIISFYNKDILKQDKGSSYDQIRAMSEQAQLIESAYKVIAISLGDMGTRLKKALVDTNEGNKSLVNLLQQAVAKAEQNKASVDLEVGQDKEYDDDAERSAAKQNMDLILENYYSSSSEDKMKIIADNAEDLMETIHKIHIAINDVAEFFSTKSNLFLSKTRALVESVGFYKPGVVENVMSQNHTTVSWEEVESIFINYGESLNSTILLFKFETTVKPKPTKVYEFQKINLKLSLPDSVAVQECMELMDKYVQ